MIVYRISKIKYAGDLSGIGSSLFPGRWNKRNENVIYTSETPGLAATEIVVQGTALAFSQDYEIISIEIPDNFIAVVNESALPNDWNKFPTSDITSEIGSAWLSAQSSLCLKVPSPLIVGEYNILINPLHPDFIKVRITSKLPYNIAARLTEDLPQVSEPGVVYNTISKIDVFLCHASEDKEMVVEPLYNAFTQNGITCWYDKNEIKWGDSITEKISMGIRACKYVIVVCSKHFINKHWPQREMNAVFNLEASTGRKIILNLLVGTPEEREEILDYLILQNDKKFMVWEGQTNVIVAALKDIL